MNVDAIQVMPHIGIRLFHSRKKLQKKLQKDGFSVELADVPGQTYSFEGESGLSISVVLIECDDTSESTMALLAHEAVHVAQAYFLSINEYNPSSEFEAYVLQYITLYLFEEHTKWVEKHSK